MQQRSLKIPVIAFACIYLLIGCLWATPFGFRTHEMLSEQREQNRYDEITRVVRAMQTGKRIIEVCVEGNRLEIPDPNGFAIILPFGNIAKYVNERAKEPLTYQSVPVGRPLVADDCSPPNEYPIDVLQFQLGSVGSLRADENLDTLRPASGKHAAIYELEASWDGGATISSKRLLALVLAQPDFFGRHYIVIQTEPVFGKGPGIDGYALLRAWALDALSFPYQIYGVLVWLDSH